MTKKSNQRLATAQGNLRRMEAVIGPYLEDAAPQERVRRNEWIPGDHAHVGKKKPEDARQKYKATI